MTDSEELQEKLKKLTDENLSAKCDYNQISDADALVLLALHKATNPRLLDTAIMYKDCVSLAPSNSYLFVNRLISSGVLLKHYLASAAGTYSLQDGDIWQISSQVYFFPVADDEIGRSEDAFLLLANRQYTDFDSIRSLWLDYAVADCQRYLLDQCSEHSFELEDDALEQIKSVYRTALETRSVSEVWSMTWKVVRDAASLSQRPYYNSRKAAATIYGKTQRYMEKVSSGEMSMQNWTRPTRHEKGTLGQILTEYFNIDETTTGREVSRILKRVAATDDLVDEQQFILQARELIGRARADGLEAAVLMLFADATRRGMSCEEAVQDTLSEYSRIASLVERIEPNDDEQSNQETERDN